MEPELRISDVKYSGIWDVLSICVGLFAYCFVVALTCLFGAGLAFVAAVCLILLNVPTSAATDLAFFLVFLPILGVAFIAAQPLMNNIYLLPRRGTRFGPEPSPYMNWFCQLTFTPRLCTGAKRFWEADDVGYVYPTEDGLCFNGKRVELSIPWSRIQAAGMKRYGPKGSVYRDIFVDTDALGEYQRVAFIERSTLYLPSHRRITRNLLTAIKWRREDAAQRVALPPLPEATP